ncbi:MAG: BatA domain-containing protein [Bacteroidales bacterium]
MTFQQPAFLYGLFLLIIPLVIHLLNFRKSKTIYFSSLRFIEEVQTTNRNRKRIQDLLLLILRMLTIALIVLSFARPEIRSGGNQPGQARSLSAIIIDNSPSMNLTVNGEVLLALAKERARQIIKSYPPGSRFILASGDPSTTGFRIKDREQALMEVDKLSTSHQIKPIDRVIEEIRLQVSNEDYRLDGLFILSDFQRNLFSGTIPGETNATPVTLLAIRPDQFSNLSIDSCWFENPLHQPGQQEMLMVRIFNHSDQLLNGFPIRLEINDTLRAEASVDLAPLSATTAAIPYTNVSRAWQKGVVKLYDYPVTFDNELFFAYRIDQTIPVLLLHQGAPPTDLARLFQSDPYFALESYSHKGFPRSDFKDYRLLILTGVSAPDPDLIQKTKGFLSNGGTVWFFPDLNVSPEQYNSFLESFGLPGIQGIATYPAESVIGRAHRNWLSTVTISPDSRLRMPLIQKMARFLPTGVSREDILVTVAGDPVISQYKISGGTFVLNSVSADPAVSDLMIHPLLVPLTYLIAGMGLESIRLYHHLGSDDPVRIQLEEAGQGQTARLIHLETGQEMVPAQQHGLGSNITLFPGNVIQPGFYSVKLEGLADGLVAFNTIRSESVLNFFADSTVARHFESAGWTVAGISDISGPESATNWLSAGQAKKIWPLLLLIALGLLLVETLVMNRKK